MREAAAQLDHHDAVMVPALDGGYVLLGLRRFHAALFAGVPWSTDEVAAVTEGRCAALGFTLAKMSALPDIDLAADLAFLPSSWPERVTY